MKKLIVFRPSKSIDTKNLRLHCVEVYEQCDYTSSSWAIVGHIPLSLAMELHMEWRWMSDSEYEAKETERQAKETERLDSDKSNSETKCISARCNGACGYPVY